MLLIWPSFKKRKVFKRLPENSFWKTALNLFPRRDTEVLISPCWSYFCKLEEQQVRKVKSVLKGPLPNVTSLATSRQSSWIHAWWDEACQWQLSLLNVYHKQALKRSVEWRNRYFHFIWVSKRMQNSGLMHESVKLCQRCVVSCDKQNTWTLETWRWKEDIPSVCGPSSYCLSKMCNNFTV